MCSCGTRRLLGLLVDEFLVLLGQRTVQAKDLLGKLENVHEVRELVCTVTYFAFLAQMHHHFVVGHGQFSIYIGDFVTERKGDGQPCREGGLTWLPMLVLNRRWSDGDGAHPLPIECSASAEAHYFPREGYLRQRRMAWRELQAWSNQRQCPMMP